MPVARKLPRLSGWWLGLCVAGVLALAGYGRHGSRGGAGTDEPPAETPLQLRVQRIDAWVGMRGEAIPTLRRLLAAGDRRSQQDAVTALARLGPEAAPAREELESALDSDDVQVREMAVYALAALPGDRSRVLNRLCTHLRDPAREVRRAAARTLEQSPDSVVAEALSWGGEALSYLRLEQLRRQERLEPGDVELLRRLLGSPGEDEFLRTDCFELLIWHDRLELPDLYMALGSQALDLNALGLRYLETVGGQAREAAPLLVKMLEAPTAGAHLAALRGLELVGDTARGALPEIEAYLHSDRCVDIAATAGLVVQLGGDRRRAASLLRKCLLEQVPGHAHAPTLLRIDRDLAEGVVTLLTARLEAGTGNVRDDLNNLRHFGRAAAPAAGVARRLLSDLQGGYRIDAAMVLEALGPDSVEALPEFIAVVEEGTRQSLGGGLQDRLALELWVVRALRNLGGAGEPAWRALQDRWLTLEHSPAQEETGDGLAALVLEALPAVAPQEPLVQQCLRQACESEIVPLRAVACAGLLQTSPLLPEDWLRARALVLSETPSPRRGLLIERLVEQGKGDAGTIETLVCLAEGESYPLADRLLALEALGQMGECLSASRARLEALARTPAGAFPGPSRVAVEGPIFGDRYKPAVRQRLALRNWARYLLARLDESESTDRLQRLHQSQ